MRGFVDFVREQGIVGLAIGFILGGAAQQLVTAFSNDLINPLISLAIGSFGNLTAASSTVAGVSFGWGHFLSTLINLILVAFVVYFGFKALRLKDLDKQKKIK